MMLAWFMLLSLFAGVVCAQSEAPAGSVHEMKKRPVFSVDVVEKITPAVNYRHRSGATRIDFKGTPLMPLASGEAKVESKRGYIEIEAKFRNIKPAIAFGAEYLTYVMWAITPEGRAANIGEVLVKSGRSKLNVTTELQVFGLVISAEPYFAVRRPSDLVVLENEVRPDTKGKVEVINAKYELLKRGQYKPLSNPLNLTVDSRIPLELYEARNAVQIARAIGADRYAEDTFLVAEHSLSQAEAYLARDAGDKPVAMLAREAVQRAEDAREIAIRRIEQERLDREREEAALREAEAKAAAEREARLRAEAERKQREKEEAERRAQLKAEREAAERVRLQRELDAARQSAREAEEEAERTMALLRERTTSFGEERARWEEERTRQEQADTERRRRLEELEKAELRVRIYSQLSRILFTRDTDDGLVAEITPEMFEPGGPVLGADGREKMAIVVGILLAHPGLKFSVGPVPPAPVVGLPEEDPSRAQVSAEAILAGRVGAVGSYLRDRGIPEAPQGSRLMASNPGAEEEAGQPPEDATVELTITGEPIGFPPQLPEETTSPI